MKMGKEKLFFAHQIRRFTESVCAKEREREKKT